MHIMVLYIYTVTSLNSGQTDPG